MKRMIAAALVAAFSFGAAAQTGDYIVVRQRNSSDTGYIDRWIYPLGSGKDGILYLSGSTLLPGYFEIGSGLSLSAGVLSSTATTPVNADWNSGSGLSQILNKPSLATVATSGSYNDLSNKPTIPTVPTISRQRIITASNGTYTWTYPTACPAATVPIIQMTPEGSSSITYNTVITATPTNTQASIAVVQTASVTILGISVLGIQPASAVVVHMTAICP